MKSNFYRMDDDAVLGGDVAADDDEDDMIGVDKENAVEMGDEPEV